MENDNNAQANFDKEEAYIRAKKKFDKLKGFYWHLAAYVVVNMFLIISVTTQLDENESFWQFETFATAIFWGIGLTFHAMGVLGRIYYLEEVGKKEKLKSSWIKIKGIGNSFKYTVFSQQSYSPL